MDILKDILVLSVFVITRGPLVSGTPCDQLTVLTASDSPQDLTSPGYPIKYPTNLECNYTIRTERSTDRVQLSVIDSDIEDAIYCQYDRLTFIDINNGTEQILGAICGTETSTYQSSGNSVQIQFVSNSLKVNKGFKIQYKAVDRRDCKGFTLTATRMDSFLISPGYPDHYYSNLTCKWEIFAGTRRFEVSVIKSSIAGQGPNCTEDRMEISDWDFFIDPDAVFCGNATPSLKFRRRAWVFLYTDGNTEAQGFIIRYRLKEENTTVPACGGMLEANSSRKILHSPLYPKIPLMNQTREWNITSADPNEIIMVSLVDLNIEMSTDCVFDSLSIYNDSSVVHSKVLETWCGQRGGEVIYSTGPYLTIVYKVDDSNNGRGFSLTYSTVAGINSTQEMVQINAERTIYYLTVGFSDYFTRNRVFSYIFSAAVGQQVKLKATRSSLPGIIGSCTGGTKVIVYDGSTNTAPTLASKSRNFTWCGETTPEYVSSDNHLLLEYHTGPLGKKDVGFELKYKQGIYPTPTIVCGDNSLTAYLNGSILTSPYYPDSYPNNLNCIWYIDSGDPDYIVVVEVLENDVEYSNNCSKDYLVAYDASGTWSPIVRWCGTQTPKYQSTRKYLTITFHSDRTVSKSGFKLRYWKKYQPYSIGYAGLDVGAVVGGTVGSLCLIVINMFVYCKCKRKRPKLITTGSSYHQTAYQPGEDPMCQQTAGPNMQGYTNITFSGESDGDTVSSSTNQPGITGGKSAISGLPTGDITPDHLKPGDITPHQFESWDKSVKKETQAHRKIIPNHFSDSKDEENSTDHSTHM